MSRLYPYTSDFDSMSLIGLPSKRSDSIERNIFAKDGAGIQDRCDEEASGC